MYSAWLVAGPVLGYVAGIVPFSYLVAKRVGRLDLRVTGSGSASPSNVYRGMGFLPAVVAGLLEVAKGAVGPAVIGGRNYFLAGLAGGLAVAGHIWCPFLRGGGGRGLSTATGALAVVAWPGAVLMCATLIVGAAARKIYPAMSLALFALLPFLLVIREHRSAIAGALIVTPIGWKTAAILWRRRRGSRGLPA
jgi:acyl phosphate:glycerol-3-phosphate acyltransferase